MSSRKKILVTSWEPFTYQPYTSRCTPHHMTGIADVFFGKIFCLWEDGILKHIALSKHSVPPLLTKAWPNACRATTCKTTQTAEHLLSQTFSEPTILCGTPFELTVWQHTHKIPRGTTWCYKQLAEAIDKPNACRAVGSALGRNPLALLIPCHRVISATGDLGNFHWGADIKKALLAKEINDEIQSII